MQPDQLQQVPQGRGRPQQLDREVQWLAGDQPQRAEQPLYAELHRAVWRAGGKPESVARLVLYVTDRNEYRRQAKALGEAYRKRMGQHYPAMVLVEVKALLEDDAKVEIEATALV